MKNLLNTVLAILLVAFNNSDALTKPRTNELQECIVKTHCVLVNWKVIEVGSTYNNLATAVDNTPRTEIIEQNNSYIHAEATTKWLHYVDDLEIKALPDQYIIQIRSESRVGIGDNGVNQKRVDNLLNSLEKIQTNK